MAMQNFPGKVPSTNYHDQRSQEHTTHTLCTHQLLEARAYIVTVE